MNYLHNHARRNFVKVAAVGFMSLSMTFSSCTSSESDSAASEETAAGNQTQNTETSMVYVGTYADPENESIFLYQLNPETGELSRVSGFKGGANPSFLTLDEQQNYLYAVNETMDYQGQNSGAVSAFSVDQQTGNLTLLNQVASKGGAPCYISVGDDGKTVLVANYMGGNVAAFPIQENGTLAEAASVEQHEGAGPNKDRQEAAHAHYVAPGPDNRYVYAVDLGVDKIYGYRLNAEGSALEPTEPAVAFAAEPGAGPRQMAFHPNGQYAYVINELNSTMTALAYNSGNGALSEIQTLSTLPADFNGDNYPAAVRVSPNGQYLYGSNRGHNSIVVYKIDKSTGKLTHVETVSSGGDWPRDFTIDLTGNVLLVANERSNNIVSFKIDKDTGKLTATGHEAEVHKPVSLQVVPDFQ
ncbi:lactonase family protein [Pontibacter diazotrophicus]|uniref:Lactonase family protein n=1 Tax=Pontibacter diazotrophicus TaxID=1400979 RepID=A0A3D8L7G6_9BACT|nr:lactonase family protein [Pontibacter diazotrophicus]RDV13273.1 lactonase family protein [Pontibacter diazotrophicus]